MYPMVLAAHNLVRWIALILGIVTVAGAFLGLAQRSPWSERQRRFGSFFSIALDIQLLLGLLLYFVYSPLTRTALMNFGAAMSSPDLRFFAVEHAFYMLLAVVFAHLGSILPRRVEGSQAKYTRAALFFTLALLFIFVGIPWTRPLLPHF